LFYGYLNSFFNTDRYNQKLEDCILEIFEKINEGEIATTFCSGIAGAVWAIKHLEKRQIIDTEVDFNYLNPLLKQSAINFASAGNFDFLHGSDGIISYLLTTEMTEEEFINEWLKLLSMHAIKEKGHYSWESLLNIDTGERAINLSLSHGISSRIILLSEVVQKFPKNALANEILNGCVEFLLSHKRNESEVSIFPMYFNPQATYSNRLAWCYGDLGNGIALWRAGKLLNKNVWKETGLETLIHCSKRRGLKESNVVDAGFCHGTSGITHIFNRFYRETGRKEFDEARIYWMNQTLDLSAGQDEYMAGFQTWDGINKKFTNRSNLLEGTMGIAMSLMGFKAERSDDLNWDECFLLS